MSGGVGESKNQMAESEVAQEASPLGHGKSKIKLVVVLALAVVVGAIVLTLHLTKRHQDPESANAADQAVIIHAAVARQGDMGVYIDALGTVTPISTVNIYSQVSGQILVVHYREGQIIRKGDPLIDVDPRPYQAQLQQAEGLLDHDRGVLKQAEIDLARYKDAFVSHAVATGLTRTSAGSEPVYDLWI